MAISSEINEITSSGYQRRGTGTRRVMAFLVEALVVLAFLMLSLAVFMRLFSSAQIEGRQASRLSQAVVAATNRAEEFSANPQGVAKSADEGGLTVTCDVTPLERGGGTLYEATITVLDGDQELYELQTSRYVSDASGSGAGDAS